MTPVSPGGPELDIRPRWPNPARWGRRPLVALAILATLLVMALSYGLWSTSRASAERQRARERNIPIEAAKPDQVTMPQPPAAVTPAPRPAEPLPVAERITPQQQTGAQEEQRWAQQEQVVQVVPEKRPPTAEEVLAERFRRAMMAPVFAKKDEGAEQRQLAAYAPAPVPAEDRAALSTGAGTDKDDEYTLTNFQSRKQQWLEKAARRNTTNYLQYARTSQVAPCEIKAGWEIPASLEQAVNSDLPGEIKALVNANVYDTATGKYLLIPQGARLTGKYNSDVAYGQERAQVAWDRIIFPDGSSVNLAGMTGMDAQGNAGFKDKVDRHYKRTFGMAFLTSAFVAAYELTTRRAYGNGGYYVPSAGDRAAGAFAGEMTNTAAMITRRNLNVQPTIKIQAGYKFTVRVNRDMIFEGPYVPETPEMEQGRPDIRRASR